VDDHADHRVLHAILHVEEIFADDATLRKRMVTSSRSTCRLTTRLTPSAPPDQESGRGHREPGRVEYQKALDQIKKNRRLDEK